MTDPAKVREDRVRRMLARQGYQLTRSNRRDPRAWDYGIYIITHMLASGADSGRIAGYCNSLAEAEQWARDGDRGSELEAASRRPDEDWEDIGTITVGANWIANLGGAAGDGPHLARVLRQKGDIRFIRLEPQAQEWVKIAEISVTSGRLMLTDPAYIGDLPEGFLGMHPDGSGVACLADLAALVSVGLEDGMHAVRVKYSDGRVAAVRVDFLD